MNRGGGRGGSGRIEGSLAAIGSENDCVGCDGGDSAESAVDEALFSIESCGAHDGGVHLDVYEVLQGSASY